MIDEELNQLIEELELLPNIQTLLDMIDLGNIKLMDDLKRIELD